VTPDYTIELYSVIHAARYRKRWSVLLVPKKRFEETLTTISALCDVPFSGRTLMWPDTGRKLTVAYAGQEPFLPKGTDFDLFLAGWSVSTATDSKSLIEWRAAASDFIPSSDWAIGSQLVTEGVEDLSKSSQNPGLLSA
jgi:hypothetical protein